MLGPLRSTGAIIRSHKTWDVICSKHDRAQGREPGARNRTTIYRYTVIQGIVRERETRRALTLVICPKEARRWTNSPRRKNHSTCKVLIKPRNGMNYKRIAICFSVSLPSPLPPINGTSKNHASPIIASVSPALKKKGRSMFIVVVAWIIKRDVMRFGVSLSERRLSTPWSFTTRCIFPYARYLRDFPRRPFSRLFFYFYFEFWFFFRNEILKRSNLFFLRAKSLPRRARDLISGATISQHRSENAIQTAAGHTSVHIHICIGLASLLGRTATR